MRRILSAKAIQMTDIMSTYTITGKPISINSARAAVNVKGKLRLITTAKARAWKLNATIELLSQRKGSAPITGPCQVSITLYMPTKAGDADNYVKMVLDAVQDARIIENDRQVDSLTVTKQVDKSRPRVEITISQRQAA
jgi:Holliday junction resolvase RusA-like endonuclease